MKCAVLLPVAGSLLLALAPAASGQAQPGAKGAVGPFEPTSASAEAKAEFQRGVFHWRNAFTARAVRHLERALQLDPDFGFARIVRGGIKPGLSASERNQELDKGFAALARAPAGEVVLGLGWREQFAGRPETAAPLFGAAAQLHPRDPDVARWYSQTKRVGRPPMDVAAEVRLLIQQFPDFPVNYRDLGYALYNAGDFAGGLAAMREHAQREPDHSNSHESLAELLLRDGKKDEAAQMAMRAIAVDSAFVSSWAVLADLKFNAGDLAGARSYWTKAVQLSVYAPDSVDMMHSLAVSYLIENDWKTALTKLGEVAAIAESKQLVGQAALVHQRMAAIDGLYGDGRGVGGHLSKAAQLVTPSTANQHIYTALAYAGARQLDQARAAVDRFTAVATDANRRTLRRLRGFIALQANDAPDAVTELTQADPYDILAKEFLAEAQAKQGQRAATQALREQVMRSATQVAGGRILDFFIVVAKQRAKTM